MYQHFVHWLSRELEVLFETDEAERGRFLEYALERPDVQPVWRDFTEHAFVAGIANGTLPVEKFKTYLIQDYLYLVSGPSQGYPSC